MTRHLLGEWRCPSGVRVSAYLGGGPGDALRDLQLEWDIEPADLDLTDRVFYAAVIRPDLVRRAQAYLEKPGRALVVEL